MKRVKLSKGYALEYLYATHHIGSNIEYIELGVPEHPSINSRDKLRSTSTLSYSVTNPYDRQTAQILAACKDNQIPWIALATAANKTLRHTVTSPFTASPSPSHITFNIVKRNRSIIFDGH